MATDASGCQDNNNVGMIGISSMLVLSMQSNMSVIYINSSSHGARHMCGDGRREAGCPGSVKQHNKPAAGFRHAELLRVSSSTRDHAWLLH
jgi:hypothetical protein